MTKKYIVLLVCCFALLGMGIMTIKAYSSRNIKTVKLYNSDLAEINYLRKENMGDLAIDIYTDYNNNEYLYMDDDLVGFIKYDKVDVIKNEISEDSKKEKLEKYKSIASEIANYFIDNDKTTFEKYTLSNAKYIDSYGELSYTYVKRIDGYDTLDAIKVSLDQNGNLVSFIANRQGIFNKYDEIKIDKQEVEKYITKEMNQRSIKKYEVQQEFISILKNKPVLEIIVLEEVETNKYDIISLYYNL